MNRNPKLKIMGFFGQSGAGKTTIIRNVRGPINGYRISHCTGIIRLLFNRNVYLNPVDLLQKHKQDMLILKGNELDSKIDEIYEAYIKSQLQLLNDFSTEVFMSTQDQLHEPTILLTDRSPIDFYGITIGGVKYLKMQLHKEPNEHCQFLISLCKKTAETNTKNFYNAIFVTHPWKDQWTHNLKDGIRDQYLTEFYTGEDWYNIIKEVDIEPVKLFDINSDITDLLKRAKVVEQHLIGL